jgi:hypothetical protein
MAASRRTMNEDQRAIYGDNTMEEVKKDGTGK